MIPASYFYKDVYTRTWGDPRSNEAEPVEPPVPGKGRFFGLIRLLSTVTPLETDRRARRMHHV